MTPVYVTTDKAHPTGCDECDQRVTQAIEHATEYHSNACRVGSDTDHYARVERRQAVTT